MAERFGTAPDRDTVDPETPIAGTPPAALTALASLEERSQTEAAAADLQLGLNTIRTDQRALETATKNLAELRASLGTTLRELYSDTDGRRILEDLLSDDLPTALKTEDAIFENPQVLAPLTAKKTRVESLSASARRTISNFHDENARHIRLTREVATRHSLKLNTSLEDALELNASIKLEELRRLDGILDRTGPRSQHLASLATALKGAPDAVKHFFTKRFPTIAEQIIDSADRRTGLE